jgi:hypothetical protein
VRTGANHLLSLSPNENESVCDSFIRSFNQEYNKIGEGDALRSTTNQSLSANVKKLNDDLVDVSQSSKKESSKFNPFTNEKIQQEYNSNASANSIVQSLQKKIKEANLSEPKSLFGGPHRTNSSSKKRKILGLPFDYSQQDSKSKKDPCKFFDLGLETVHENVKDKNCATIDVKDTKKDDYNRNLSHNKNSITKKVVNGNIVQSLGSKIVQVMPNGFDQTKLRLRKASQGYSGQHSADVSNRCMSDSKNSHQLESKSSFASVAQQILNNSSISSNERSNHNCSYNYMAFDSSG